MFYNRALFREAGIPAPPTNRAEFMDALRKIKALKRPNSWGFVYNWLRINAYGMLAQNGGDIFAADGRTVILDSAENIEALRFCAELIKDGHAAPPQDFDSWIGFRQGRVAMTFHGIFMLPDLQRVSELDWAAAPVPTLFRKPATWVNSHNVCVRADLKGPELAAAKKFITYLSDHSLDWAAGGQVPVRKSLRASERFETMVAQREFARQIPYVQYMPNVPFVLEYLAEFDFAVERVLRGSMTPEVALKTASASINKVVVRHEGSGAAQAGAEAKP
jgi:multiple sugar transport system substrate-binding protein